MTEAAAPATPAAPPGEAYPGAGFPLPTGPDGTALGPQETINALLGNPRFVAEAKPGTYAWTLLGDLNKQAAGQTGLPPANPNAPDPAAYRVPYPPGMDRDAWGPEQTRLDSDLRGWIAETGLNAEDGSSLASLAAERLAAIEAAGGSVEAGMAALREQFGNTLEPALQSARELVARIEAQRPGVAAFLEDSGLGNDPLFIARLISLARR